MAYQEPYEDQPEMRTMMPRSAEHNILRFLPFFLAFLLFALMGWAAYRGYQSVHPKPKPVAAWYDDACHHEAGCEATAKLIQPLSKADEDCHDMGDGWDSCGRPYPRLQCNDGHWVRDLRGCPEYEGGGVSRLNSTIGIDLAHAWKLPRKHKRKTEIIFPPYDRWTFINTVPAMITCSKLSSASAGNCSARPLTPEEIDQYTPGHTTSMTDYYSGFVITDAGDIGSGKNTVGEWRCDKCPDPIPGHQMTEATKDTQIIWDESAPAPTLHRHEPDCKMPADVDVCPVQMLEPKASHD